MYVIDTLSILSVIRQGHQPATSQIDITTPVTMVTTGADESEAGNKMQLNNSLNVTITLFRMLFHLSNSLL